MSKKYSSVEELINEFDKEAKLHPIKHWFGQRYYAVVRFIENIIDIPMRIKCFIQRGQRGWSDRDWWNLDYYISNILIGGLNKIKKEGNSHPPKITYKEWKKVLNNMIDTFKTAQKMMDNNILYIPTNKWNKKQYKDLKIFTKNFNKKHPEDKHRVLTKKQVKKFEEGFDLFKEYFFQLWD